MINSGLLKFPGNASSSARKSPVAPAELPHVERFDLGSTMELYKVAKSVYDRSIELVDFVDADRNLARQAGVETIAIEVSSMLEGGRFGAVLDTLRDSASKNQPVDITQMGIDKVRRMEKLLAEASSSIANFLGSGYVRNEGPLPNLGQGPVQNAQSGSQNDPVLWAPFLLFGVVAVVGIAAALILTKGR